MAARILIADDQVYIRLLMEQTLEDLESEGVEFFSADNGATALEIIASEKPDLVFLDVMMPAMDGFEVCQAVRRELGMHHVYIVILTAKGQELDRQRGEQVGANTYMTKPFDPDELLSVAKKALGLT